MSLTLTSHIAASTAVHWRIWVVIMRAPSPRAEAPLHAAAMQMNAGTGVSITQYVVDGALEMLVHETPISPSTMSAK